MTTPSFTLALVGNPNTGKSTLFNALTGLRQHVGNYPGVTVEMKKGHATFGGATWEVIDLPGTYSLAPRSLDEMVSVDLLLGHLKDEPRPHAILAVVDASNLERHLYLTTQLMELGVPVVIALNMVDVAAKLGQVIDVPQLATQLGVPVVAVQANKGVGLADLHKTLVQAATQKAIPTPLTFPPAFQQEARVLRQELGSNIEPFLVERLLLDVGGHTEKQLTQRYGAKVETLLSPARARLAANGCAVPAVEAKTRYAWIRQQTASCITRPATRPVTFSDRLDRLFTHKIYGTLVFLLLMFGVFEAIFIGASPLMDVIDEAKDGLVGFVQNQLDPGPLRSLLTDGVLKGVGGVLIFLPQIMILFAVIAVLEDCGYMARAAFLMDKIMAKCGLNGKSFIPLLSSVACAVPGIMATRVIENRRDRLATILVAPLMSCSARLPLYMLLIGAFLSDPWWLPGVALFGLYLLGLVVAPLVALTLKRTILRGETPVFVMEMPAFKRPQLRTVLRRMLDAGWAFVYRAGTMILATMILVWATLYFPNHAADGRNYDTVTTAMQKDVDDLKDELKDLEDAAKEAKQAEFNAKESELNELHGEWKRGSYLGRAGRALEPVFRPLGWDWKIGMAALASFPAREVVVGTLGIIYNQGDVDPGSIGEEAPASEAPLAKQVRQEWSDDPRMGPYRVPIALSLLVFFALCCQCISTLAVIKRETNSYAWPVFTFVYMTVLAYVAALATYQLGALLVG